MISRPGYVAQIKERLEHSPVVAILGSRQVGKTTLARQITAEHAQVSYFDLEDPRHVARLQNPMLTLEPLEGLVVIDEIQRMPDLFTTLRVLADAPKKKRSFLILGSASPHLVKGVSESLAGRVAFVEVSGFSMMEVPHWRRLWLRGGYPDSYTAVDDDESYRWRDDFIRTYLERDLPALGITTSSTTMRRFWMMLAHHHGQVWNAAEFGRAIGSSESSARRYLDILCDTFVVRRLTPWHENISKRQVKSPKTYIQDTGLLHTLLNLKSDEGLSGHPKVGASWEGFAIDNLLRVLSPREVFFWATHAGAELDLLHISDGRRVGFEMKYADTVRTTKSMREAIRSLNLDHLFVVYPGQDRFLLDDGIEAVPLPELVQELGQS